MLKLEMLMLLCSGIGRLGMLVFSDVATHRAVLNLLCKKQLIQEVETVLSEMEKINLNVYEYYAPEVIKMYVFKGLLDQARIFLKSAMFMKDCHHRYMHQLWMCMLRRDWMLRLRQCSMQKGAGRTKEGCHRI